VVDQEGDGRVFQVGLVLVHAVVLETQGFVFHELLEDLYADLHALADLLRLLLPLGFGGVGGVLGA
jgi:hypothetical protein